MRKIIDITPLVLMEGENGWGFVFLAKEVRNEKDISVINSITLSATCHFSTRLL